MELKTVERKLNTMITGIEQIFAICKCSNAPLLQLLGKTIKRRKTISLFYCLISGDNTSINYFNVLLYLQLLEQQVNYLMMFVYYKQKTVSAILLFFIFVVLQLKFENAFLCFVIDR